MSQTGGERAGMPSVLFVTEGGGEVGLGHISRCRALARALVGIGGRAAFLVPPEPTVQALLGSLPATVVVEPWPLYPARAVAAVRSLDPDAVVVDSYKASIELFVALRALAPVVAVDDTADRPLPVDVVVNGGVAAESLLYDRTTDTVFLLGSRYALLDPQFADSPERPARTRVSRLLVTLGGGPSTTDLTAAIAAADAVVENGTIDVAAGPFGADAAALDAIARAARNRVIVHRDRFGLRALMLEADLAVSGAGMTLYELSAVGTPAVTVCMADNQEPNAAAFDRAGAAPCAARAGEPALREKLESVLRRLAGDAAARADIAGRARRLVDGRGAARVAEHILRPALARR